MSLELELETKLQTLQHIPFFQSLANQLKEKGYLSKKQWECIAKHQEPIQYPAIKAFMLAAKEHLKFPKIRLNTGHILALSSYNNLYIKSLRGSYPEEVLNELARLEQDPVAYAKVYGQQYSHCCFCGLELTNQSSIYHGYGPICAEKWGLPWGDIPLLLDLI